MKFVKLGPAPPLDTAPFKKPKLPSCVVRVVCFEGFIHSFIQLPPLAPLISRVECPSCLGASSVLEGVVQLLLVGMCRLSSPGVWVNLQSINQ